MEIPPPHVLAQLDAIIVGQSSAANDGARATPSVEEDDDQSTFGIESSATSFSEPVEDDLGGTRTTSSRFWGVCWDRTNKKWRAYYYDADCKRRHIGLLDDEEEAARAVNKAIRDAGLEGRRKMNAVDATGALVPRVTCTSKPRDHSAVVAPDPTRAQSATTSKYWGVSWSKKGRRWQAKYRDADGKYRHIGRFDTQEDAARAYNAAIRRAGLEGRRKTNPVVDGQLVPRARKAKGHGRVGLRKRRRDEPAAAAPSTRPRN